MKFILFPKLTQLYAENCGIAILNPGWIHPIRKLSTSVLILGKKSKVEIIEETEKLSIEPEKVVILTADRTHAGSKKISESASYYWMHFSCAETPRVLDEEEALSILCDEDAVRVRLDDALLIPQEMNLKESKKFLDLFRDILFEQEQPSFTRYKLQLLFKMMMISINESVLSDYIREKYDANRYIFINPVIQTILENYTDGNFSVKALSDKTNYNPDYLCRMFKARMGRSLSDYIIDQRIKYAVCLLVETNNTVDSVAHDCGFNSARNFIRQFKSRKGETPSELRLRHRTMHVTNR